MTTPPEDNGYANLEFPEFYEKMHTKKDNTWIDDICAANHSKMLSQREESSQSGVQWTPEGMSGDVLGKRKRYILGFGVGPKPTSSSSKTDIASQARDEELQNYKANMEKIEMEREEEKREREQERREREHERREREEEKRQREEERREYEAVQKKMADRLLLLEEKTQAHSSPTHRGGQFITSTSTRRESEKQRRQQEVVQKNKEDLVLIWQENSKALGPRINHGGHISSTSTSGRRAH
ncbi:vicilin-like seed storage protein At2g18540 [Rhododendron vialii]|uniref:vicilin-like seed storage protein At2g18540 n=1 Tax=Rhododendron vialii TaxID=182163 RepID=UPI00265FFAFA|nr:vicilin-like seed storage protein At2g18540 [Rhododendron vialii]